MVVGVVVQFCSTVRSYSILLATLLTCQGRVRIKYHNILTWTGTLGSPFLAFTECDSISWAFFSGSYILDVS